MSFKNLRSANDSLILYLAKKSIEKFKELFPDEEPFIKIVCLRDKRLTQEYKSGLRSWRKMDITGEKADIVNISETPTQVKAIKRSVNRDFYQSGSIVTNTLSRGVRSKKTATEEKTGRVVMIKDPDLTFIERQTEVEIDINQITVMAQSEVNTSSCDARYDYIWLDKTELKLETIDSSIESGDGVLVRGANNVSEAYSSLLKAVNSHKELISNLVKTEGDKQALLRTCEDMELKIAKPSPSISRIQRVLNTTETAEELSDKYLKLQEKLNMMKKQLRRYTVPEELQWESLVKKHVFIMSIPHLVHFWYGLTNDEQIDYDD
jgi:hypothetical protein